MKPDPHPPVQDHACPNCEAITSGNFCHHCGQETHLHVASLREFLHEFVGHYVALEGRLWGTLGRLMFRPGALTNEYIRGRRVRFVQPLRLYLTFSLIFFAVLKFSGGDEAAAVQTTPEARQGLSAEDKAKIAAALQPLEEERKAAAAKKAGGKPAKIDGDDDTNTSWADITVGDRKAAQWLDIVPGLHHSVDRFEHLDDAEKSKVLSNGFYHYAPYAIFCMMPVFAFLLKLLYLGSGRRFGEHLLFALHTNAFAFALLTLTFLPLGGFVKFVLWVWLLGYLPWAMRRVYHSSRAGTLLRWSVLMFCYSIAVGLALGAAGALGALTAH